MKIKGLEKEMEKVRNEEGLKQEQEDGPQVHFVTKKEVRAKAKRNFLANAKSFDFNEGRMVGYFEGNFKITDKKMKVATMLVAALHAEFTSSKGLRRVLENLLENGEYVVWTVKFGDGLIYPKRVERELIASSHL